MEAAELSVLMFSICLFGTLIYGRSTPGGHLRLSDMSKAFLMGIAIAVTTASIIRSRFGRRTGAHFNPSITLAYFYLGRIHRWDTLYYVAFQFTGALVGVFVAYQLLGRRLSGPPVRYVITTPGIYGTLLAFVAEFVLSAFLMAIVLFATNHKILARFSPFIVALVTVFYYGLCSSLSGFSVNPARSFSSAIFAWAWQGMWIYFLAPCLGMLTAAFIYARCEGRERVYCAKVFHDLQSTCPFFCNFEGLYREPESFATNRCGHQ